MPFTRGGPARAALIGGQTDCAFLGIQQLAGFEGQLRALAVNAAERDGIMKDVPSFGELGIPFAAVSSPVVMVAPKGVPADVVAFLEEALKEIVAKADFVDALASSGTAPAYADGRGARTKLRAMKADAEPLVADLKH